MPSLTRREALVAASTGIAVLAGCSSYDQRRSTEPAEKTEIDYEFERVRSKTEPVLFWTGERSEITENDPRKRNGYEFITRNTSFADVSFSSTDVGDRLQSFASETNFETESIFLYSTGVSECQDLTLQSVTVAEDTGNPHLDFCQSVRAASVECSEDVDHTIGYAVRLPIDGSDSSGSGTGMSHGCGKGLAPSTFDTTVTVQSGEEQ